MVKIYNKGTAYDVGGGLQFTCLSNLIDHYKRNPMAEMNGEVIQLNEVANFIYDKISNGQMIYYIIVLVYLMASMIIMCDTLCHDYV